MHSDLLFHSAVHFPYMDNKASLGLYLISFSHNDVHKSCMAKRYERLRGAWNITVILPCKYLTEYCRRDLDEISARFVMSLRYECPDELLFLDKPLN